MRLMQAPAAVVAEKLTGVGVVLYAVVRVTLPLAPLPLALMTVTSAYPVTLVEIALASTLIADASMDKAETSIERTAAPEQRTKPGVLTGDWEAAVAVLEVEAGARDVAALDTTGTVAVVRPVEVEVENEVADAGGGGATGELVVRCRHDLGCLRDEDTSRDRL